jgi:predicted nucleic acid-binding protein
MSGKTFLDTNVVVYLYSGDEPEKQTAALALIERNNPVVSTQVLSKLANTLSRKIGLPYGVVAQAAVEVRDACTVVPVMPDTIAQALALAQKYRHSYYDSLYWRLPCRLGARNLLPKICSMGRSSKMC